MIIQPKPVAKLNASRSTTLDYAPCYTSEITIDGILVIRVYGKTKKLCDSRAKSIHQALIKHQIENE